MDIASFLGSFNVTPYDASNPPIGNFNIGPDAQHLDSLLNTLNTLTEPDRSNAITALNNQLTGASNVAPVSSNVTSIPVSTGSALHDAVNAVDSTLSTDGTSKTPTLASKAADFLGGKAADYGLIVVGAVLIVGALLISQKETVISVAKEAIK
jgi:hypothetical protein